MCIVDQGCHHSIYRFLSTNLISVNMVVKRVSTDPTKRVTVTHMNIATDRPIAYPSEWFDNPLNDKPKILIAAEGDITRAQLHATVQTNFPEGDLDHRVAMMFLRHEMMRKSHMLGEDWTSFGRAIGVRGGDITIGNLVIFDQTETRPDVIDGEDCMTDSEVLKYIILICSMYRLAQISRDDYRTNVVNNVTALIEGLDGEAVEFSTQILSYRKWLAYHPYIKMMAAIDMYLNEFPYHQYASARIGTIVTRFKDCSVLVATKTITEALGLTFDTFAEWIWTARCANQFVNVIKGGEEMDNQRSYSMYFMDFGLSPKSPYSATVNADLHLFYHTIGVSSGLERSRNARYIGNPEHNNIINNAMVIHYVLGTFSTFDAQFSADGVPIELEADDLVDDDLPGDNSPELWLGYIISKNGRIPPIVARQSILEWNQFPGCRESSIGLYLYKRAQTLMVSLVAPAQ
ncbi:nucleoprotein [Ohlsdorf virus]|uniref:Nucleoprotein n=1 Tax=Ohlsdorf virus TaxID=2040592 RepID=A0A291I346_9RHAB|nr:nucleoprotein [Ohlsdorf virus]ATG83558.1 nucleoprotein [Ohlsdorf virus]